MPPSKKPVRPKYQLFASLPPADFEALKKSIRAHGVLVPIEHDETGAILDGHHRVQACAELRAEGLAIDVPVIVRLDMSESEKREHVRSLNSLRRHLNASQRRVVIREQLLDTPERSDRAIAKSLGASPTTVAMIRHRLGGQIASAHNGQLKRVGLDGRRRGLPRRSVFATSPASAKRAVASLQTVPAAALPGRILTVNESHVAARMVKQEASREQQLAQLQSLPALHEGRRQYVVLYADPPWQYEGASDPQRKAERHYRTMSHQELLNLPVARVAAEHSVLFLWAGSPKLAEALALIEAWGYAYRTSAVWNKSTPHGRLGLGSFYRQTHELLLIATRGHIRPPGPAVRPSSVISAPRGAHSAKPAEVRTQIERMYPGVARVELFARGRIEGWDTWGLEAVPSRVRRARR